MPPITGPLYIFIRETSAPSTAPFSKAMSIGVAHMHPLRASNPLLCLGAPERSAPEVYPGKSVFLLIVWPVGGCVSADSSHYRPYVGLQTSGVAVCAFRGSPFSSWSVLSVRRACQGSKFSNPRETREMFSSNLTLKTRCKTGTKL